MENVYIVMLVILFGLSITGLVVGVSNDAVNFLTSAIGSKVTSTRIIIFVASIGVLMGAVFSSGMMVIPRTGIFHPGLFSFQDIMVIYTAVILANIFILDFMNSLGLPTSTTVSIIFELLGAAVCIAFVKNIGTDVDFRSFLEYIHTSKVVEIVIGLLLSVVLAFTLGAIIQYISRFIFTFQYEAKLKYFGAIFGGFSLTAMSYFVLIKGLGDSTLLSDSAKGFIDQHILIVVGASFLFWTLVSQFLMSVFKVNILKVIVLVGTFSIALAYAGNDLMNFIGVPLAASDSFNLWHDAFISSGVSPSDFSMDGLANDPSDTSVIYLLIAGIIMVLTLWFSGKAKTVVETGINLSRQGDGTEKYEPNELSRVIVRYSLIVIHAVSVIFSPRVKHKLEEKFKRPDSPLNDKRIDAPAFDTIRASVNMVVAAILISVGTSMKLPLSTTYVTFMVAMGTSLSDRAWDRESAVYRVTGVLNVIGGWLSTALIAFFGAAILSALLWYGGLATVVILSVLAVGFVVRSAILHSRKVKAEKGKKRFNRQDIITINEITLETSQNITSVINGINKRYSKIINHLGYHDLSKLKKDSKKLHKLEDEVEELKDNVFYFIKSLEENSVEASKFYILLLDHLNGMVESLAEIVRSSYKHVNNNHKNLKFNQIRDLKGIDRKMQLLFDEIIQTFDSQSFENISQLIQDKQSISDDVSDLIQKQINRIRTSETSPKNTKLYFGLLLETKDLIKSTMSLLQLFQEYYEDAKREF